MSLYVDGELPVVATSGNCNNGGMFGNNGDWIWAFLLFALIGNNGWGGIGYGGGRGGYGSPATVQDVASGFSTSEIMSDLNDIILGQSQGFANVQQTLCQGFSGVNATVTNGFTNLNTNLASMAYNTQSGFNAIANQIASCCCDLKQLNLENRYLNEKQTCEIVSAINAGYQRLVDIYTADKMASKDARIATLESIISNKDQTETILRAVNRDRCPEPAYLVPNPNCCYNYGVFPTGACGASVQ